MKFYIKEIILWSKDNKIRELKGFENNKVNVITGDPSKGKTAIIEIIDFCLLSSKSNLVKNDDFIEKVYWFGLSFVINENNFFIARNTKSIQDIYFSELGNIPKKPYSNFKIDDVKKILNREFNILEEFKIPYGGKFIKKNTKISYRNFLVFNTQRRNVLSDDEILFDIQKNQRKSEILDRIFDIAIGVISIEDMLKREKLEALIKEKQKLESKIELIQKKVFSDEVDELIEEAKSLHLISDSLSNEESLKQLQNMIEKYEFDFKDNKIEILEKEKFKLKIKLRNFKKYKAQYQEYKTLLKEELESLKPIEYIKEIKRDLIQDNEIENILNYLEGELKEIKKFVNAENLPAIEDLSKKIKDIESEINKIDNQISLMKKNEINEELFIKQMIFLGKFKAKQEILDGDNLNSIKEKLKEKEENIELLKKEIKEIDRQEMLNKINLNMKQVLDEVNFELRGYKNYLPIFDYKTKNIKVQILNDIISMKNVGSSSNHLFLHLAFFCAIHRVFIDNKDTSKKFIPQFLILDQVDSPFYNNDSNNSEEIKLIKQAFQVLDKQIEFFKNKDESFQIILLEHIECNKIKEFKLNNFKCIEEWRRNNALVPLEWKK